MLKLEQHQLDAIGRLRNGCILNGGVGSGKSLTALGYYYLKQGGSREFLFWRKLQKDEKSQKTFILSPLHKNETSGKTTSITKRNAYSSISSFIHNLYLKRSI